MVSVEIDRLEAVVVAGYTGRDRAAVDEHIAELAAMGVAPPATVPAYWGFPPWIASQSDRVTVVGDGTSGEVEPCLVVDGDDVYLTVASDHTDRAVEAVDIGLSKHVCPKVIGREAWPLAEVADRLDRLELRSWVDGDVLYQDGTTAALVDPRELLVGLPFPRPRCFALLGGTVPTIGGLRPAARFRGELRDPATGACLTVAYDVDVLDTRSAR
ncbi:MAG TPA: DUF2848 family protein [Acidimicrobiales bacterium]|nr:DUF2848 family protein [Acidimicrobiales bacterium]